MKSIKSLKKQNHPLSDTATQLKLLTDVVKESEYIDTFSNKIRETGWQTLTPSTFDIFQVNVGYTCNQTCKHCHVDAGPDRKEVMTRETMQQCLDILTKGNFTTVDLTGGAPEMNPDFRWFVEEISKLGLKIIDRCNLTIITANKKYHDLPDFLAKHQVEVVSSLPFYNADRTDRQRGEGVFGESIKALKMLNEVGYGKEGSGLVLNLVYNPTGAFLPAGQEVLENQFKKVLKDEFNIEFNNLFTITNLPVSRYLDYLDKSGNLVEYMEKLFLAYNPATVEEVMCRNTLSISWDGYIYDCDFNQMLDLKMRDKTKQHIRNFDFDYLQNRNILISQHCFGCTAGAGSSCGGELV